MATLMVMESPGTGTAGLGWRKAGHFTGPGAAIPPHRTGTLRPVPAGDLFVPEGRTADRAVQSRSANLPAHEERPARALPAARHRRRGRVEPQGPRTGGRTGRTAEIGRA